MDLKRELGDEKIVDLKINGKEEPVLIKTNDSKIETGYYFPNKIGTRSAKNLFKNPDTGVPTRNFTYILEKISPVHRETAFFKTIFNYQLTIK